MGLAIVHMHYFCKELAHRESARGCPCLYSRVPEKDCLSRKPVCSALHRISALRGNSPNLAPFGTKARPRDVAGVDRYALRCLPCGQAAQYDPFSEAEVHVASSVDSKQSRKFLSKPAPTLPR